MSIKQGTEHLPTGKNWKKLPPIKKGELHIGCLNCSTAAMEAPLEMEISVGYGLSDLTLDGITMWDENEVDGCTVARAEEMAAKNPDHDWRIHRYGAMHGETYQRHGPGKWVCVESNRGFA